MSSSTGDPRELSAEALVAADDRLAAAVDMIRRTGATSCGFRYHPDEQPVAWIAVAEFAGGIAHDRWEAAAGHDPLEATLRLCEELIDGGMCANCGRPTGFEPLDLGGMPSAERFCWYQYDPGAKRYVRGCAG